MDEWIRAISGYLKQVDVDVTNRVVRASAAGHPGIVVDRVPPPPGVTLSITDVGASSGVTRYTIASESGLAPDSIWLFVDDELRSIAFQIGEVGSFRNVRIHGGPGPVYRWPLRVEPAGGATELPDNLRLNDGYFDVKPHDAPTHLFLRGARLTTDVQGVYRIIEVKGRCALPARTAIAQLRVHQGAELTILPDTAIREAVSATDMSLYFKFRGAFSGQLSEGADVTLVESARLVIPKGVTVKNATLAGTGSVVVVGSLVDSLFLPDIEGSLLLDVSGSAEGVSGDVVLQAAKGAVVIGSDAGPLRVREIAQLDRAEVASVSLYELTGLANLGELRNLSRFSMWLGRDRRHRMDLSNRMTLGGGSEATVRQKRGHFWASLADILKEGHATGRTQSVVRYNAMRFRRAQLEPGVERSLLSMYSVIGYGESIALPLIWIVAMCLGFSPFLAQPPIELSGECCPRLDDYANTAFSLLQSPLAFFKSPIKPPEDVFGPLETFLLVSFQIVSLVMLFFSLSAVRRIVKAE